MQIVNGCQTSKTLALALQDEALAKDSRVLLRVYETSDLALVDKIVLTTNNQNKITSRDLKANAPEQIDMENGFKVYGYFYERKSRQYDNDDNINSNRIMVNETVGRSYLAIVLKIPSDASRRKYKVWSESYDKIFEGTHSVEPYILSTKIYLLTSKVLSDKKYSASSNDVLRKLANNGSFHVARITAYLWRTHDKWDSDIVDKMKSDINMLENTPQVLTESIEKALHILVVIFKKNKKYLSDIDGALKLAALDESINAQLYKTKRSSS